MFVKLATRRVKEPSKGVNKRISDEQLLIEKFLQKIIEQ